MTQYTEKYYIDEIKKFWEIVENYCNKKSLEISFDSFINNNKKNYCNENFKYLTIAPKILLVSSITFKNFFMKLDKDFQYDLMDINLYVQLLQDLKESKKLKKYIKNLLQDDFIYRNKK